MSDRVHTRLIFPIAPKKLRAANRCASHCEGPEDCRQAGPRLGLRWVSAGASPVYSRASVFLESDPFEMLTSGERRVLVVDDERIIADTAALIFSKNGFTGRAVYSAEEALDVLLLWTPHLAVIDVQLTGMSGIDLAIRMKAEYPACKLVLLSGFLDAARLLRDAEAEGHEFKILAKPVAPLELLGLGAGLPEPSFGEN